MICRTPKHHLMMLWRIILLPFLKCTICKVKASLYSAFIHTINSRYSHNSLGKQQKGLLPFSEGADVMDPAKEIVARW